MAKITNLRVGEGNKAVDGLPSAHEVIAAKKNAKHPFAANNV
ncbi:hypothetical protein [Methylomonas sp. YC3]